MLPLCSAPLIALLVAGEDWSLFHVWNMDILLGYHNISYLINASIYLVKGGRLGLMPGVLFHSCRPSFRHISVMVPDFAFLTRLGYNGNPLTVRLEEKSSSKAQPWFYHLPPSLFPLGVTLLRVIIILPPPLGQCSSECWSNRVDCGVTSGNLRFAFTRSMSHLSVP